MTRYVQPSIRGVLFGSMLLLASTACRRSERSDMVENRTPPQGTSSQGAPVSAPTESPSAQRGEQGERIHVTGKDVQSSLQDQRQEEEHFERIHVTGKDDKLQGGGGTGGASGTR